MCLTNIHIKEFFLCVIFVVKISEKTEKNFFVKKKNEILGFAPKPYAI